jgi:hypothetical protein
MIRLWQIIRAHIGGVGDCPACREANERGTYESRRRAREAADREQP